MTHFCKTALLTALLGSGMSLVALPAGAAPSTLSVNDSTDGIVAQVNNEVILKSELIAAIIAMDTDYRQKGVNLPSERLQNEALDALIMHRLQIGIINRSNVSPNENAINAQLLQIAKTQGFNSLQELQMALDSRQAGSYAALREQLIEEAALQALWQHQIRNRVYISEHEIDAFLASPEANSLKQEEYSITHVRVPYIDAYARLSDDQKQSAHDTALRVKSALENSQTLEFAMNSARQNYPKELQGANIDHISISRLPTELASSIVALSKGQVTNPIATETGVDVIKLVDKRTNDTVLIPEWQTSHILIGINNNQSEELARHKIEEIYKNLQQGADFAELAATYSEDTGSAVQRGSLGWVPEAVMVPEFEAVMKNTQKGDYSTPFRTQFGWHILKVDDTRTRDVTTQHRRNLAREALFNRLAPQAQEDWLQELRAAAYIKIMP